MAAEFPFDGQSYPAREKKFGGTVFFVHFFEGEKRKLVRHIQLVNRLGCDAFAFNLFTPSVLQPPFANDGRFGLKHLYADQIELLLNRIDGPKLIYSFSNPTAAAIEAMARRHCSDIVGLIADSGPSSRFVHSVDNLYARDKHMPFLLRLPVVPAFSLMWSPHLHHDLGAQLASFPEKFPVLSLAGGQDPLISPSDIHGVFAPHPRLDWREHVIAGAGHLNGLRDFRADYEPAIADFISHVLPT